MSETDFKEDCVFCDLIKQQVALYENNYMIIIRDINPQARLHYLIISKKHFTDLNDIIKNDIELLGKILKSIEFITPKLGIPSYRLMTNNGKAAGQQIMHLHFHLMCD